MQGANLFWYLYHYCNELLIVLVLSFLVPENNWPVHFDHVTRKDRRKQNKSGRSLQLNPIRNQSLFTVLSFASSWLQ